MRDIFDRVISEGDYILYTVRAGIIKFGLVTDILDKEILVTTVSYVSRGSGKNWELQKNGLSIKLGARWNNIMILDTVPNKIKDLLDG